MRFDSDELRATLTPSQLADLMTMHPSGQARFWGAVSSHDSRMDTLATGDIVLFTGKKWLRRFRPTPLVGEF